MRFSQLCKHCVCLVSLQLEDLEVTPFQIGRPLIVMAKSQVSLCVMELRLTGEHHRN